MKNNLTNRYLTTFSAILISSLVMGLIVTTISVHNLIRSTDSEYIRQSLQDTVKGKTIKPENIDESNKAMASGDGYFAKKDYLNAKAAYQLAIDANPENKTAREKLQKTMDLLRSQKAQNILFDVAIAAADKLFQAGDYEKAKTEYENASKLLPGDPYPKNRINEIIKIQVDKKVKDDEYAKAIASGDKSFMTNNLQLALLDYKKAAGIKPSEKYPQQRIKEINDLIAVQRQKDEAFNKAIATADQQFSETRYHEAIKFYRDAIAVKPEQVYPKNRITEAEGLISRNKMTQYQYDKYLSAGDSLYIEKQYMKARENYLMASSVKPNENYPKEMISKADKMLTGQEAALAKALEEQYQKTIREADAFFTKNSLEPARAEYVKAGNLKPTETYPKERIKAIDDKVASLLKDKEEAYQKAIASGDKALAGRVLEMAKSEYQNALTYKPDAAYPKAKLAEVDKLMAIELAQKAEDAKYTDAIAIGDSLFFVKAYQPAKARFQAALAMKPKEAYPRNRIAEIDAVIARIEAEKTIETRYNTLIAKADKEFTEKQYQIARDDYSKASEIKTGEQYPKERKAEIDRILGDLATAKALDTEYRNLIVQADKQFMAKTYEESKLSYENAGKLKPSESYPPKRISEIDQILADLAAKRSLEENYLSQILQADKLLTEKSYLPSKEAFQKALVIKPSEVYPKNKIAEIDKILAEIARQKKDDDSYANAVAEGDKLLADNALPEAKAKYQLALTIKSSESYPKEKIAGIDKILAEDAAKRKTEEQYLAAIKTGDDQLTKKAYAEAKAAYNQAAAFKPAEQLPKDKLAEVDRILAEIAALKDLNDRYTTMVKKADNLFTTKAYTESRVEYESALKLKPEESYPKTRLDEISKIEAEIAARKSLEDNYLSTISSADQLLAAANYEPARAKYNEALTLKPAEKYPKTRITEIDAKLAEIARKEALEKEYTTIVSEADKLLFEKALAEAKNKYLAALKIKPGEAWPTGKIAEIDQILAEAKALNDRYHATITKADQLFTSKSWEASRAEYENAQKLKPVETYPATKIAEIEKVLAAIAAEKKLGEEYQSIIRQADKLLASRSYEPAKSEFEKALTLKPNETLPKTKISEIDAILADLAKKKAIDDEYISVMAEGDRLLAEKSYDAAKGKFQRALELKGNETLPKTKIAECDKALTDIARLKAIDEQYASLTREGDGLLSEKSYDKAKEAYIQAGKIKPSETYPASKIKEIDAIFAALAKQKALDDQYEATIRRADQQLTAKSWEQSKKEYLAAQQLKPGEKYPGEKISEIDRILAELKAKDDAYKAAITTGEQMMAGKKYEEARTEFEKALEIKPQDSYAKGKITEITRAQEEMLGKQKFYDNLIADADKLFGDKDFPKSKDTYQRASNVFPDQKYPKDRIILITNKLDSIYKANKSKYDKAIGDGDKFYNNYEYDKAIDAYTEAANLLPMEAYPRDMIVKIRRTITENAVADVLNSATTITSNDEKQFAFTPVSFAARKNNFVYIKVKNLSGKPINVLVRYGKNKQPNGGVVMRNISSDGKVNERLVSVRDQDLWSREDNNWISLVPQGGDIEVSFIQVSRARQD
jgi:tetratricopeptide (TPR) repeat protein